MPLVTRETICLALQHDNPAFVQAFVGRALVALFGRQIVDEQQSNQTRVNNMVGFTGADGRSGSLTAKYWLKHGKLEGWMVEQWTRQSARTGRPRLAKYHRQLNEIALSRRTDINNEAKAL